MYNFTIAWSWSRLSDFEKCALMAFWKHYAPKGQRCPFTESPALIRGRKVHRDLEVACRGIPLPDDLNHMYSIIEGIKQSNREGWVLDPEIQLTFNFDYSKGDWFNVRNTFLRTGIDLLMRKEHRAIILDWKTGKINPSPGQNKLYAMSVMIRFPKTSYVNTGFVWVDHKKTTMEDYSRSELPEIQEEFEERVNMIQIANDDRNWIPNPSDFNCKWCPCNKAQCKYGKD